ncbi:MAG: amidohydrolase [Planctomycetota bacterium]
MKRRFHALLVSTLFISSHFISTLSIFALLASATLSHGQTLSHSKTDSEQDSPTTWVDGNIDPLIQLWVSLHKNPELSFQEVETAARIQQELEALGIPVTSNVGGHGIVGILENGEGPLVMVRTDLDGLPIFEKTNQAFASTKEVVDESGNTVGVMHACGHDVHMTSLVGTARFLVANTDLWSGTIMFIGQPAEERGAGAMAMLEDGLYDRFGKPDYALALHCSAVLPTGSVAIRGGYAMANVDSVDIHITGRGGHGAWPHTTIDPIVIASRLVLDIQTIVSREVKPIEPAVITVGSIHAGTKHNIIADDCHLQLTVRSYSDEVRELLIEGIKRKANAAAMSSGAPEPEIIVSEGTPSLSNDDDLAARISTRFGAVLGGENVIEQEPVMGGEDFSHFGRSGVPSVLYFLGVVDQRRLDRYVELGVTPPSLHSAEFYPDVEDALKFGVITMSSAVLELVGN